jgi:hypothetical protein
MPRLNAFQDVKGIEHTRQLEEDMGISSQGCKCQTKWVIFVEHGEIIERWETSSTPAFLQNVRDKRYMDAFVDKDGEWHERIQEGGFLPLNGIRHSEESSLIDDNGDKLMPIHVFKGGCTQPTISLDNKDLTHEVQEEVYFEEPCSVYTEQNIGDALRDVIISDLPDGIYEVIMEQGCWSNYSYTYACNEGDGDATAKLYLSVKLENKSYYDEVAEVTT